MSDITIFYRYKPITNFNSKEFLESIKAVSGISQALLIGKDPKGFSELEVCFSDKKNIPVDQIEIQLKNHGISVSGLCIRLSAVLTHQHDAYDASAVSLKIKNSLENISGIIDSAISAEGIIKIEIDPNFHNIYILINKILEVI